MEDPLVDAPRPKSTHCRMCAKQKNYAELLDLSADVKTFEEYIDIVQFLQLDFINLSNETLPKTTCEDCYDTFQESYTFFKKLKTTQEQLKNLYNVSSVSVKIEPGESTVNDHEKDGESSKDDKKGDDDDGKEGTSSTEMKVTDEPENIVESEPKTAEIEPINTEINPTTSGVDTDLTAGNDPDNTLGIPDKTAESNLDIPDPGIQVITEPEDSEEDEEPEPTSIIEALLRTPNLIKPKPTMIDPLTVTHCRFCAQHYPKKDLIHFKQDNTKLEECHSILSFFKITLNLQAWKLPNNICEKCFDMLEKSHIYFKSVKRNQHLLSNIYNMKLESLLKVKIEPLIEDIQETPISFCEVRVLNSDTWMTYPWICKFCFVVFEKVEDLRAHSKEVHGVCHAMMCADCKDTFDTFASFVEHVRTHRDVLRLYCPFCESTFESPEDCTTHVNTHFFSTQRICVHCGEIFPYQNSLDYHLQLYGKKADEGRDWEKSWIHYEWRCSECPATRSKYPDLPSLRFHIQSAHDKCFAMRCMDCPKTSKNFKLFVAHAITHRPYLRIFCQYCNKRFDNTEALNKHIIQHITSQKRPCNMCGQIFEDNLQLAAHKKMYAEKRESTTRRSSNRSRKQIIHLEPQASDGNPEPEPVKVKRKRNRKKRELSIEDLTCKICNKYCENMTKYRRHVPTHDVNRPRQFACQLCGKAFLSAGSMRDHIKKHSGKTEECQMCHKKFFTRHQLKAHIVTHSEEKPFICDECGTSFKTKLRLKCHLFKHTDVKPFKCAYCYKEFKFKENLKTHEYQHTGVRPYACEMCDRTFTNWANCNKHMIRKHGLTLARTKITEHGRMAIDRRTGEASEISKTGYTVQWFNEMLKPDRPGKKPAGATAK